VSSGPRDLSPHSGPVDLRILLTTPNKGPAGAFRPPVIRIQALFTAQLEAGPPVARPD
jgi:hypothetical protein